MSRAVSRSELSLRRADVVLIAAVICLALLCGIGMLFGRQGRSVTVAVDGKAVAVYPLDEDREVWLTGYGGGKNRLVISGGAARIAEADCKDGLCARHAAVSRTGDVIICLPHRLTVTVDGAGEAPDAVIA